MTNRILLLPLVLSLPACSGKPTVLEDKWQENPVPFAHVVCEKLEPMAVPRAAHALLRTKDGMIAVGGHTSAFIPTATAELFDGKNWTRIPTCYAHDGAFAAPLSDGRILFGGGSSEAFGIGQSWGVELYDPASGEFSSVAIMQQKRAYASALAIPGDTVIVSGNWYADDSIERYVPGKGFETVKATSQNRCQPYIFRSSEEDVLVFSGFDIHGKPLPGVVDRLRGEPFEPPLLKEWRPSPVQGCSLPQDYEIGEFTYLVPGRTRNGDTLRIAKIQGERFSYLPTVSPVPTAAPDGAELFYCERLVVARAERHAYMFATDSLRRLYLLDIDYDPALDGGKAPLRVLWTNSQIALFNDAPMALTPEGNLMLAGGSLADNFHPTRDVLLIRLHSKESAGSPLWWLLLLVPAAAVIILLAVRRKTAPAAPAGDTPQDMMSRIRKLVEKEELFRRPDLRLGDIASRLGTNNTYISACINSQANQSFSDFIAGYRVRYAASLLKNNPSMRVAEVAEESGFTSERSFFRVFKAETGTTPSRFRMLYKYTKNR